MVKHMLPLRSAATARYLPPSYVWNLLQYDIWHLLSHRPLLVGEKPRNFFLYGWTMWDAPTSTSCE